jgi:hypothetical protein
MIFSGSKKIDLYLVFSLFLKNKKITFLSILFCFFLFFPFFLNKNNTQKNTVVIKLKSNVPQDIILKIKSYDSNFYFDEKNIHLALPEKINSFKNFLVYIHGDNNKEFLKILEKYSLTPHSYFYYNLIEVKDAYSHQYSLSFPKEVDGLSFLNNYIIFSKELIVDQFYNDLRFIIDEDIKKKNNSLKIAKDLKIDFPRIDFSDKEEFLKGEKVLSIQIEQLQLKKKSLSRQSLDWDPVLSQAIKQVEINDKKKYFLAILFTLSIGFLLSLLVIFFKNDFKKK